MSQKKLSSRILDTIQKKDICPRPQWHFWLKNGVFWGVFILAAVFGGRAISVIILTLDESEFDLLMEAHGPIIHHLTTILPLVWLVFFLLLALLAAYGLQHTKKGYKLSALKLMSVNLIISLVIGGVGYAIGDAEDFEEAMHHRASFFKRMEDRHRHVWSRPEEGRLAGIVVSLEGDSVLILDDFNEETWTVDYTNSKLRHRIEIRPLMKLRIVGQITDEYAFEAKRISPWKKPKRHWFGGPKEDRDDERD